MQEIIHESMCIYDQTNGRSLTDKDSVGSVTDKRKPALVLEISKTSTQNYNDIYKFVVRPVDQFMADFKIKTPVTSRSNIDY